MSADSSSALGTNTPLEIASQPAAELATQLPRRLVDTTVVRLGNLKKWRKKASLSDIEKHYQEVPEALAP